MENNVEVLGGDTDSLFYHIKTEDVFEDIAPDVHTHFHMSNYPKNHSSCISVGVNKKVLGLMKDECEGNIILECVGLRAKMYTFRVQDGYDTKKAKGVPKKVVRNNILFENYKECLFG